MGLFDPSGGSTSDDNLSGRVGDVTDEDEAEQRKRRKRIRRWRRKRARSDSEPDNDRDSGGEPDATTTTDVSESDRYGSSSPIGSGSIEVGLDDSGRAVEGIGGSGSGSATESDAESVATPVARIPSVFLGGDTLERVTQEIENATGGLSYGARDVVDDIGSGTAVTTTALPPVVREPLATARNYAASDRGLLPLVATVVGGIAAVVSLGSYLARRD